MNLDEEDQIGVRGQRLNLGAGSKLVNIRARKRYVVKREIQLCRTKWASCTHPHVCPGQRKPEALYASRIWRVRLIRFCPSDVVGRRPETSLKRSALSILGRPPQVPQAQTTHDDVVL